MLKHTHVPGCLNHTSAFVSHMYELGHYDCACKRPSLYRMSTLARIGWQCQFLFRTKMFENGNYNGPEPMDEEEIKTKKTPPPPCIYDPAAHAVVIITENRDIRAWLHV